MEKGGGQLFVSRPPYFPSVSVTFLWHAFARFLNDPIMDNDSEIKLWDIVYDRSFCHNY